MTRSKTFSAIIVLALCFAGLQVATAQTKTALIIGIDMYKPADPQLASTRGGWTNLDGCVNDAEAIKEIIKGRFGFEEKNITTVYNQDAKRERLIAEFQKLIDNAKKGDIIFIYYAGHGSQVYNSLSTEASGDKYDETIVPADMIDIRDKEFAAIFNKLIDKGAILTLIFDSCHSGSIARGNSVPDVAKTRHINGSEVDAKDASSPQLPEDRGALVLSAAQPEQLAKEAKDDNGNPHGAFTVALIKALSSSSVNEAAEVIFLRIKAIMQANGNTQEPVIGGNQQRRSQGLFGEDLSVTKGKTMVAVMKTNSDGTIELQGGWAVGLNEKCELKKSGANNPMEKIVITEVSGLSKSKAKMVSGDISNIKAGDLFEVVVWSSPSTPNLQVWFPSSAFTYADILKTAQKLSALANNKDFTWITDPTEQAPTYIIQYFNNSWKLCGPNGKIDEIGKDPNPESVSKKIAKGGLVYLQLPPSQELIKSLQIGAGTSNTAIEITQDALAANYILVGRYVDNVVKYAWIRPNLTVKDTAFQSTLPVKTDWLAVKDAASISEIGNQLSLFALRLGKINAWLNLSGPPNDGSFPFSLALKNMATNAYITDGTVIGGEQFKMVLVTNKEKLKMWDGKSRYIYVFAIDVDGKTQQIFPEQNTGNEGNKLPTKVYDYESEIPLGNINFTIGKPYGIDSYFMIATDDPINNFQAFNCEGVVTREGTRGGGALDNLINDVGTGARGITPNATPATWTLQKFSLKSKEKK
ncbi:MAG: caspase family protein [Bacteroidota bacterium]